MFSEDLPTTLTEVCSTHNSDSQIQSNQNIRQNEAPGNTNDNQASEASVSVQIENTNGIKNLQSTCSYKGRAYFVR